MISPDNNWAILALMTALAAAGLVLERTRLGSRVSGAVLSILMGMAISNSGVLPHEAPAYDIVWNWLLLLGIPLLLFEADLRRIFRESGPLLIAYGLGAIGSVLGALVAYGLVPLGSDGWKITSVLSASYVGGSVNYMATAKALDLTGDGSLLAAGAAADNLAMALFFIILFSLPSWNWLRARFPDRPSVESMEVNIQELQAPTSVLSLSISLALSFGICAIGLTLGNRLGFAGAGVLIITILSVSLATFGRRWLRFVQGHREMGMALMQIFFVVIGLSADVGAVLRVAPILFIFLAVMLTVHLTVLLIGGKLLRLDLRELVLASNANCGGPTTAAAMAISKKWNPMVAPIILCGTLGYAVANLIGLAMAWLLAPG